MVITNHGLECFKLKYGDQVIATNPPAESSDFQTHRFGADIVLVSARHEDFSGADQLTAGDKEPIAVTGPGEYEIDGISIDGVAGESRYGGDYHINTIYVFRLQDMDICFMGPIKDRELPSGAQELMEHIDILFAPVGNDPVLDASDAYKLAVQIEPKIVIPTHFTDADDEAVTSFLDEAGSDTDSVERKDKLTVSPRDLSGRDTDIEVIVPQ